MSNNINDISKLRGDMMNSDVMPDFKRLYLCDQIMFASSRDRQLLLEDLLTEYDKGMIDVSFDLWDGTVKYKSLDIN